VVHLLALRGPGLYRLGTQAAFFLRELRDSAQLSETTDSARVDVRSAHRLVPNLPRLFREPSHRLWSFAGLAGSDISDGWPDNRLRFSITP
jgi:hypothetical protein